MDRRQGGILPVIWDPINSLRQNGGNQLQIMGIHYTHSERVQVDRRSLKYLVDFLREDAHEVKELVLGCLSLSQPSGGSLHILRDLFANDTALTKVHLENCDFGSAEDASQVLSAFQSNQSVTDLRFYDIENLDGAELGACLSALLQNNTHLQKLDCSGCNFSVPQGIPSLLPGFRSSRTLKDLQLDRCRIGDEGLRLLADALIESASLEVLNISYNRNITSVGLSHVIRLLEFTQLRNVDLYGNHEMFRDEAFVSRFSHVLAGNEFLRYLRICLTSAPSSAVARIFQALQSNTMLEELWLVSPGRPCPGVEQLITSIPRMKGIKRLHLSAWGIILDLAAFVPALRQNTSIEELIGLFPPCYYPQHLDKTMVIKTILSRNRSLNHAKALLALQPRTRMQIASKSGIWHAAMARLAPDASGSGASAIFHILQQRPALMERQLLRRQQPHSNVSHQRREASNSDNGCTNGDNNNQSSSSSSSSRASRDGQKRARPSD